MDATTSSLFVTAALLAVAVIFARAAVHKLVTAHDLDAHPALTAFGASRRHPRAALATAGAAETLSIAVVFVVPAAGALCLLALLALYSAALSRLPSEQSCNCFGAAPDADRGDALRRNAALAAVLAACVAALLGGTDLALDDPASFALALLLLAPLAGKITVNRLALSLRP